MSFPSPQRPADARPDNWVERLAPKAMQPYLVLMRADRPVGVWLLLWPCWWSIALAAAHEGVAPYAQTIWWTLVLFGIGAFVMRAAGCIINDLWDREIDSQVARTAARPLASGAISPAQAYALLALLSAIGLAVLLQFNSVTILLGLASIPLVIVYPLAKRWTWWPQIVLGLVFNWGALMGWSALGGSWPGIPALIMYAGCIAWTVGYDTIYAHQDKEDDAIAGIKSSALRLGTATRPVLTVLYLSACGAWAAAGYMAGLNTWFHVVMFGTLIHLAWQTVALNIDDPGQCLRIFKSNIALGAIVFAALLAGHPLLTD